MIFPIPFSKQDEEWKVFVILHKKGNHWGFPKGHPEKGEKPEEAARRELLEETGLNIDKLLTPHPISEEYTFYRNKEKVLKEAAYFLALVSGDPKLQQEEVREGRWLDFETAIQTLTFPEARALLNQAIHELKNLV